MEMEVALAVLWLTLILVSAFALAFVPFYWQGKRDERLALATPDEEWEAFGEPELRRQGHQLYRAVPENSWLTAVYQLENEARERLGTYQSISRHSGELILPSRTLVVKSTKFRRFAFSQGEKIVAEGRQAQLFPAVSLELTYGDQTYRVVHTGKILAGYGKIYQGDTLAGRFKRPRASSNKYLYAMAPSLPEEVRPLLMYLAFLG